jgi:hypothetical protein
MPDYLAAVLAARPGTTAPCPWGPRIGPHRRECLCWGTARVSREFLICAMDLMWGTWG